MKIRIFDPAIALLIAAMAPQASATCTMPKSISTYNPVTLTYLYWHSTLGETCPGCTTVLNKIWNGAVDYTGTCLFVSNETQTAGDLGLSGNFADACVGNGSLCPSGSISLAAAVAKGGAVDFLAVSQPETPGGGVDFDFSQDAHPMVAMGRPHITDYSVVGMVTNLNVSVDAASVGFYDGTASSITGYNILSKASTVDPGRLPSGYDAAPAAFIAAVGGGAASGVAAVDCSNTALTRWIAVQIVTTAGPLPFVSPASQTNCSPALADPKSGNRGHKPADKGR